MNKQINGLRFNFPFKSMAANTHQNNAFKKVCFLILLWVFVSSCKSAFDRADVDKFITRYNKEDFSEFANIQISLNHNYFISKHYLISKIGEQYPPYTVTFNVLKGKVTSVNRLFLMGTKDYLSNRDIDKLARRMEDYGFCLLRVDSLGSVYINPFQVYSEPILIKAPQQKQERFKYDEYLYKRYKGAWFLKSGY